MKKNDIEYQLEQLKETYIKRGFTQFLKRFFNYIFEYFIAIGYTYKIDLDKIEYVPNTNGLTFEIMTKDILNLIFRDYKEEMNEKLYRDLLEKLNNPQFDGFVILKNIEICGYCFINYRTTYPILKNKYVDESYNGYLLNEYVIKKYRNQKILQYGIYNMLQILKQKKYRTATTLVSKYNYPARFSNEKFGFKKCVMCYFFRFGKLMRSKDNFKIVI